MIYPLGRRLRGRGAIENPPPGSGEHQAPPLTPPTARHTHIPDASSPTPPSSCCHACEHHCYEIYINHNRSEQKRIKQILTSNLQIFSGPYFFFRQITMFVLCNQSQVFMELAKIFII